MTCLMISGPAFSQTKARVQREEAKRKTDQPTEVNLCVPFYKVFPH